MPKLTETMKHIRQGQARDVLLLMSQSGLTQEEACRQVGISQDQLYRWAAVAEESLEEIRKMAVDFQKQLLLNLLSIKNTLMANIATDAMSENADPKDRIAAYNLIAKEIESLERQFGANTNTEDNAANYLKGPNLKHVPSRTRAAVINVNPLPDGSVDITTYSRQNMIDVEAQDVPADADHLKSLPPG